MDSFSSHSGGFHLLSLHSRCQPGISEPSDSDWMETDLAHPTIDFPAWLDIVYISYFSISFAYYCSQHCNSTLGTFHMFVSIAFSFFVFFVYD